MERYYTLGMLICLSLCRLNATEYAHIQCKECPAPLSDRSEYIVQHTAYRISYNYKTKIANWAAYELTAPEIYKLVERNHKFVPDPKIPNFTVVSKDYTHSGFDRGHLVPAADMAFSAATMNESFYLSNIVPQNPSNNKGVWKKLEELARSWALEDSVLWIVNVPVFDSAYISISPKNIAVPTYLCKLILARKGKEFKGIAFFIKNAIGDSNLKLYVKTIDEVEKITGIDFFYQYPQKVQDQFESQVNLNDWTWR